MEQPFWETCMKNGLETLEEIVRSYQENIAPYLITITDPEVLRRHGWKEPLPGHVTASKKLWDLWRESATRKKRAGRSLFLNSKKAEVFFTDADSRPNNTADASRHASSINLFLF